MFSTSLFCGHFSPSMEITLAYFEHKIFTSLPQFISTNIAMVLFVSTSFDIYIFYALGFFLWSNSFQLGYFDHEILTSFPLFIYTNILMALFVSTSIDIFIFYALGFFLCPNSFQLMVIRPFCFH